MLEAPPRTCALHAEHLSLDIPGRRLLDDISLELAPGETASIMGPSGSGKTSLLNCLAGIVPVTAGRVALNGTDLAGLGPSARAALRLRNVGFVFQFGELLPELSVFENVALPLKLQGVTWKDAEARALRQLARVGLDDRARANPEVLSGGEVQRVALARATAGDPALILADEPTGSLDDENARVVCDVLFSVAADIGAALIIGTHNPEVAARAGRQFVLRGGRLVEQSLREVGS